MKKQFGRRKFWLKVLSLVFSVFIWLYVVSTTKVEVDKSLLINYVLPAGQSLAENYPEDMTLTIEGPRLLVRKFLDKNQDIKLEFNQSNKRGKNRYQFNLTRYLPKLPFGVELVRFTPKNLQIKLEKTAFKKVPVELARDSKVLEQFEAENLILSSKEVEISGPRSIIKNIRSVQTELLNDFNIKNEAKVELDLQKGDERLSFSKSSVFVSYKSLSNVSEFTFKQIPIIFQSTGWVQKSSNRFATMIIKGSTDILKSMKSNDFKIYAKVNDSTKKNVVINLSTDLAPGFELIQIKPDKISVSIER